MWEFSQELAKLALPNFAECNKYPACLDNSRSPAYFTITVELFIFKMLSSVGLLYNNKDIALGCIYNILKYSTIIFTL